MFLHGGHPTIEAFLVAYNDRFNATKRAGNFARDFKGQWAGKLRIKESEIKDAERHMKYLQKCLETGDEGGLEVHTTAGRRAAF